MVTAAPARGWDREAAERVGPTLPETGVCGGSGLFEAPDAAVAGAGEEGDGGCCAAPAAQVLQAGTGGTAASGGC